MAAENIVVRYASLHDVAFVSQDRYLPPSVVERKIKERDVVLAFRGALAVGYLRLERLWSKLPYIEIIRVLEPHRRSGVGRAMLAFVAAEATSQGHTVLYSSSQTDEPEPQAWHRRMGFEECGILNGVNEGGVGEVFFRKTLA